MKSIMDSGASVTVVRPRTAGLYRTQESEGSKRGQVYQVANKETIPNLGEKLFPVVTDEGTLRGYSAQVADVASDLSSIRQLYHTGHMVVFDGPDSFMVNKETGEVNIIEDDGENYNLNLWVVPPEELPEDELMGFHRLP